MSDDLPQVAAPAAPETAPVAPTEATVQAPTEAVNTGDSPADANEDTATSQDDDHSGDDSAAENKPKFRGGFQKRIDELTRKANEEARQRIEATLKAQQYERENEDLRRKTKPASSEPGPEPDISKYTDYEVYKKDRDAWIRSTVLHETKQQAEAEAKASEVQRQQEAQLRVQAQLQARETVARQKYPDYDQVINQGVGQIIRSNLGLSEYAQYESVAPDVFYQLAKNNPAKLLELAQMHPVAAVKELTRLEDKLHTPPPPKPATKAPDPIKPVGARETTPPTLARLAESDDVAKYVALRRSQAAK